MKTPPTPEKKAVSAVIVHRVKPANVLRSTLNLFQAITSGSSGIGSILLDALGSQAGLGNVEEERFRRFGVVLLMARGVGGCTLFKG